MPTLLSGTSRCSEFVVNENASKGLHEISVIFPLEKNNIYNVWGISFDNEFKLEAGGIVVDGEPVKKQLGTPKFSIKKANSGKGVKLTVSKTKNATGFYLYYTDNTEVSLENLSSDDKDKYQVVKLKKDGTKKWTYTIKQLPKGTYKFMLVAINKEGDEQQSKEKTFKVKPKGKKK